MNNSAPQDDEIICQCFQVSEGTIRACIRDKGLVTIEQVTEACEAGGGCHSCHILIELFLEEHRRQSRPMEDLVVDHANKVTKKGILSRFFSRFKPKAPAA